MIRLDVGCGFLEGIQTPELESDVSLDLNLDKASLNFIKNLKTPIIGDAQNLPFRQETFHIIYWNAILEHLSDPVKAIKDGKRVLREKGEAHIKLPVITNHERRYLKYLFIAFPFSISAVLRHLIRHCRYFKIKGVRHLSEIKPSDLRSFFKKIEVKTEWGTHAWFSGRKGRLLKKLLKCVPIHDPQGQYIIRCIK